MQWWGSHPDADQPFSIGADEARRRPVAAPQWRVRGQSGNLPPQTHRPLLGRLSWFQQNWLLAVLLFVLFFFLPTGRHLPTQGSLRTTSRDGGVVEGRGVVWVCIAVGVSWFGPARRRSVVAPGGGLAEGSLARVAVVPPASRLGGEEGAAAAPALSRVPALVGPPPHWAAGPALDTH